jgi:ELWxxDGT repeat protein
MKKLITVLSCLFLGTSLVQAQAPVWVPGQYLGPPKNGVAFNGKYLFTSNNQLWSSDGTVANTLAIKVFTGAYMYGPYCFREMNGKLYFVASDSVLGEELWVTDGTAAGTTIVKDINTNGNSSAFTPANNRSMYPNILQVLNGKLYFAADDGVNGRELWESDGTMAGTVIVKDINPGTADGIGAPLNITNEDFVLASNKIFFSADDGSGTGAELWATDGTATGTQLVKDIVPGIMSSNPYTFIAYDNKIVFSINYYTTAFIKAVYVSDGTAAGTIEIVNNICNTYDHSVLNNKLYFGVKDYNNDQLYVTDGTLANTSQLLTLSLETGVVPEDVGKGATCLTEYNGKLYFRNGQTGNGMELWQSDGTIAGTAMLKDIYPGSWSTHPNSFLSFNGRLYFRTDDSMQMNINYTDGTLAGTVQVPSPYTSYFVANPFVRRAYSSYRITPVGSTLFFTNTYDVATKLYKLEVPAGINEIPHFSTIDIYPNPTSGSISIDVKDACAVSVCDMAGRTVYYNEHPGAGMHQADVSSLAPGTYTITTLLHDGSKRFGKFVKQ